MIKRTGVIIIVLLVAAAGGFWICGGRSATAQTFSSPMIISAGVCNPHLAFRQYQKVNDMRTQLQSRGEQLRQDFAAREQRVLKQKEELAASLFVPGSQEYERMYEDLVKSSIETKTFREISQSELTRQDMLITQTGYEDIYAAITEVAKNKQLTIVLAQDEFSLASARPEELMNKIYTRRPVLYADQSLDITAEVVGLLNSKYKLGR